MSFILHNRKCVQALRQYSITGAVELVRKIGELCATFLVQSEHKELVIFERAPAPKIHAIKRSALQFPLLNLKVSVFTPATRQPERVPIAFFFILLEYH